MHNPGFHALFLTVSMLFCCASSPASAAKPAPAEIRLPRPDTQGGKPLMAAVSQRRSERDFSGKALPRQEISNLLWAAWGINRPDGRRTAPSARNTQKAEVYVALENGVWRYDAVQNRLIMALREDARKRLGGAPLTLLFAAPEDDPFSAMLLGSLYQNAGLYCASAGLANVVKRTGADALDGVLPLPEGYKVQIIQAVGWPEETKNP